MVKQKAKFLSEIGTKFGLIEKFAITNTRQIYLFFSPPHPHSLLMCQIDVKSRFGSQ